ncbi:helix-turn-helix domain-containing protein [Paraburkholderia elongata]|uniref:XRE family transcriptional regulator n=1 Tax=Paraburkholderia elongata TaxID=2675747 RepID=A0A972SP34_9BURK|nr:XRE family transcriptional regulator [Paraburkholderia elongata]NPT58305.1 XRE family transcriptional regulator [Paraburkholderia elongata]
MNRRLNLDAQLESTLENNSSRRAFAARLDMTIKRAKVTSSRVARSLGVPERDVTLWRAGVTVPKSTDCERLSELLHVDLAWLCADEA